METKIAVIVKSSIKLSKGFDTWQAMVKSQVAKINEMGIKFLFAGTENDDCAQLHAIMMFPTMEVLQDFGFDAELTEIRKRGGAVIESGVMTPISDEYFTNFPDARIKHKLFENPRNLSVGLEEREPPKLIELGTC